jgi:thimet oligopeptidase
MTTLALTEAAHLLADSAQAFLSYCDDALDNAKRNIALLKRDSSAPPQQRMQLYDDAVAGLGNAAQRASLAKEVHPSEAFRIAAESCEQRIEAFLVELSLDAAVFESLLRIDLDQQPADTGWWLKKTLREFRRLGVDRSEAVRTQVKSLSEKLVQLGQTFGRNIREDTRTLSFRPESLSGLPNDWLFQHPVQKDGTIAVTTNTPDYVVVMTYAKEAATRAQLWHAYRQRAFPANVKVLQDILLLRQQLAQLLGYDHWADYVTETKMVKNAANAAEFIERGKAATMKRAAADFDTLLTRKQKDFPDAATLDPWDFAFYEDRVLAEQFQFDSQQLRNYFEYDNVKLGTLAILEKVFSVRFEARPEVVTWHADVETYDLFEQDSLLGRIHLDMHPREGKYQHAAQFGLTTGVLNQALPEAVLVCNFPKKGGLLQHSDVETLFHEFGHLLHDVFAGTQRHSGISGIKTEWDFVEVPSMLLQEWPLDGEVLQAFAKHHLTAAPIPGALVAQMKKAKLFGVGLSQRRQFFLSAISLEFHRRPAPLDTVNTLIALQESFAPVREECRADTHFELSFGHLDGYSAVYYTYQWSTVIAKDLLERFRAKSLLSNVVAREYQQKVLKPGGSKEAEALVTDFLGRPSQFDAYARWLEEA